MFGIGKLHAILITDIQMRRLALLLLILLLVGVLMGAGPGDEGVLLQVKERTGSSVTAVPFLAPSLRMEVEESSRVVEKGDVLRCRPVGRVRTFQDVSGQDVNVSVITLQCKQGLFVVKQVLFQTSY